jgi:hypothetical protein
VTAQTRITIPAPDGSTILAARHLDPTEGRVQIGSTVDASTRSAITRVLDYIATAHNAPSATPADAALDEPAPAPGIPVPDDSGPADLTGYLAPDPPIGCLTITTATDRLTEAGVDTPGCDCGHDGMGAAWHGDACAWAVGLMGAAREVLAAPEPATRTTPNNPAEQREQVTAAIEHEVYEYRERTMLWGETEGVSEEIARLATRGALEALTANPAHTRELIDTALRTTPRADCTDWPPREAHGQGHRYDMRCALCAGEADTLADAIHAALQARPELGQPKEPS